MLVVAIVVDAVVFFLGALLRISCAMPLCKSQDAN